MKTPSLVLSIAITATVAGAVLASSDTDAAILKQISNYRGWTRLNPDPVEVSVPASGTFGVISIDSATLT